MARKTMVQGELLTRGALAAETGCNIETVRYYEQIGILPPPPRSEGGHRLYGPDLVSRLQFVRRARDLGFTLEEIRELLGLVDGGDYTCAQVEGIALAHVQEIRRKIADLNRLKRTLETMAGQCSGGRIPACPIIDALFLPRTPPRQAKPAPGGRSVR
ncbi:MAG TPA: helix-turn-helix domain-containing protein [Stellaceae bacterium]|nr:helix-turn-helix domain-containing protein [Stellaceae bacterium]